MAHEHAHPPKKDFGRAFALGITLNVVYILVEAGYGISINSLALIADAGHNLSDVLGLLLAWAASFLVRKSRTEKYTYGFKKSSVLAAFLNALILLVAIGAIIWEAVGRLSNPHPIPGTTVMLVAGIGVLINTVTALLFFSGRKEDLNIKGAFLHMAADAAISFGVVLVGIVLTFSQLFWLDPLVSIVIALIIFWGTWGLLKDSVNLALDAVPDNIDKQGIETYINSLDEVVSFHDLHIWAMSTTETALTVHIVTDKTIDQDRFIHKIYDMLSDKFSIQHTTIQIEHRGEEACRQNRI
ncbi:MAG TPA: cation transporter [Calditrichaeota bacterium]|nr:cation transporter [Calditrichota bacterium]